MSHTFTRLTHHVVFSTKHRRRLIHERMRPRLHAYMAAIMANYKARALCINGTDDHVHLLLDCAPTQPIADLIRIVKTNSSKWIHETFADSRGFQWQGGYAAFTVSASKIAAVTSYIKNQEQHHRRRTFEEELIAMLDRAAVEYEAQYVFENH